MTETPVDREAYIRLAKETRELGRHHTVLGDHTVEATTNRAADALEVLLTQLSEAERKLEQHRKLEKMATVLCSVCSGPTLPKEGTSQ